MAKRKSIIIVSVVLAVILIAGSAYYYYCAYIVTDHLRVEITPPVYKVYSLPELPEYTKPKVKVSKLGQFKDKPSIDKWVEKEQNVQNNVIMMLQDNCKRHPKDPVDLQMLNEAKATTCIMITFNHHRNFNTKNFLKAIIESKGDWNKTLEYCKENDITASMTPVF